MGGYLEFLVARRRLPLWAQYALTLAIVAVFVLLRQALYQTLTESFAGRTFLLLVLPVFLAALLFDYRSGLLATALAIGAVGWLWIEPRGSIRMDDPDDVLAGVVFLGICLAIVGLTEALRNALRRIADEARERQVMLQELNHRVGNDFQVILSMLQLAGHGPSAMQDIARRVTIMGRVYGRLRQQDRAAVVNARDFVEGLTADLQATLVGPRPIVLTGHADPVDIGAPVATTIGLAVNELVTNSVKYAFPDGREGSVCVRLAQDGGDVVLTVADDGVGYVEGAPPKGTGLGRLLLKRLVAQNGGSFTVETGGGVTATIRLPR